MKYRVQSDVFFLEKLRKNMFFWWFVTFFSLFSARKFQIQSETHFLVFFKNLVLLVDSLVRSRFFFGFKTTFCWICTPKIKKYFFGKNVLGSYGNIKVYQFHVFSFFFQKSWSFCDFDPTYHWLRHFHFCFLAKFTQQTAVVKAFSTISVITLCSSRRVRWQLMGPIRNFWHAKKIGGSWALARGKRAAGAKILLFWDP